MIFMISTKILRIRSTTRSRNSNNRRIMRTGNSKMRKFCPRSETCKKFTAQLPVVAKLRAFKVGKQFLVFLMIFDLISIKYLGIRGFSSKFWDPRSKFSRILKNSKKYIIFRKFQLFQLWTNISPSSDGVGRKTGYLSLRTRRVLSREHVFRTNGEVLKTAN